MVQNPKKWENKNTKISLNYVYTRDMWNHETVNIDDIFSFAAATEIMNYDDFESCTVVECKQIHY